ncbi:MAG: nucleoside-diphosphate kinase [Chloroflexota bacterium]|nr:nucleoside-diphosphate kinase [Chloroflexota bacterium]
MPFERTLVIIKPDGVQRGLVGPILSRLESRGLKLVGLKLLRVSREFAESHYAEHEGKPFYPGLLTYITSGPVVVACVEGSTAVQMVRNSVGTTNPLNAAPGTIRADLALDIGRNLIHASDAPETAERELALWFQPDELVSYAREIDRWIFE